MRQSEASVGYIMRPCLQVRKKRREMAQEAQTQKDEAALIELVADLCPRCRDSERRLCRQTAAIWLGLRSQVIKACFGGAELETANTMSQDGYLTRNLLQTSYIQSPG